MGFAGHLILHGIPRSEKTETQNADALTIDVRHNEKTTPKTIDDYKPLNTNGQYGTTHVTGKSEETVKHTQVKTQEGNNQTHEERIITQSRSKKQTDALYWDNNSGQRVRSKKSKREHNQKIEWRKEEKRKINNVLPKETLNASAEGSLNAFAGAKAEAQGAIALEWKSTEVSDKGETSEKEENGEKKAVTNDGFLELAKAGGGAEGWAGVGAGVDFSIRFAGDQVLVRTKLAASVGLGAGLAVDMSVSPNNIYSMLMFMYEQLRKADYSFLPYITQEAWEYIQYGFTKYLQYGIDETRYAIEKGLEAGELLLDQAWKIGEAINQKIDENIVYIQRWWRRYEQLRLDVDIVADNIITNPHGLRIAPPDVKARLITDLIEANKRLPYWDGQVDEHIEDAILSILQRVGINAPVRPMEKEPKYKMDNGQFNKMD